VTVQRLSCVALLVLGVTIGCSPELVVGKVEQEKQKCSPYGGEGGAPPLEDKVVEMPWSTGFENGFCDYEPEFCYELNGATREIVSEPVLKGRSAAAFRVNVPSPPDESQTRCFLQSALPVDAVFGAWFYLNEYAETRGNWNLMYIQGTPGINLGLWDVSLHNGDDGNLHLHLYGHDVPYPPENNLVPVPIREWFHVEFRLRRATDATGAVALYQDGVLIHQMSGIVTDRYEFHEFYVGNLADDLSPAESTVYVDEVTIRPVP
jgi:hypothetical protein